MTAIAHNVQIDRTPLVPSASHVIAADHRVHHAVPSVLGGLLALTLSLFALGSALGLFSAGQVTAWLHSVLPMQGVAYLIGGVESGFSSQLAQLVAQAR